MSLYYSCAHCCCLQDCGLQVNINVQVCRFLELINGSFLNTMWTLVTNYWAPEALSSRVVRVCLSVCESIFSPLYLVNEWRYINENDHSYLVHMTWIH